MARSGSPQNPMSEMMIPLSSKVLVDGALLVQSQTSFFPLKSQTELLVLWDASRGAGHCTL